MTERVAIVGVGWSGFRPVTPEVSYKELTYEAAVQAYADAGIDPRRDVDSFVTVAEDFIEGTSIFDEYTPDQLGATLRPMHTICGDGLHGLATAYMLIRTGRYDVVVAGGPQQGLERPDPAEASCLRPGPGAESPAAAQHRTSWPAWR